MTQARAIHKCCNCGKRRSRFALACNWQGFTE